MSLIKKKTRLLLLFSLLVILTAGLFMPWVVSWIINTDTIHAHISDRIYQKTGLHLTSQKIHVDLFPRISLQINDIQIRHQGETTAAIGTAHVILNLSAFIRKKIKIEEIQLKNGHISVGSRIGQVHGPSFLLPLTAIDIESWSSDLFDYFSSDQENIKIRLVNFQIQHFDHVDALLVISKKPPGISVQMTLYRLFLDQQTLAALIPAKQVNLHSITAKKIQLDISMHDSRMTDGRFYVHDLKILPGFDDQTPVNFEELDGTFTVSESHSAVRLTTSLSSFPQKNVSIDFSHSGNESSIVFSGDRIDILQARNAGLNILPGSRICKELFWILQSGTADHIKVSFSSTSLDNLFKGEHLELSGAVSNGTIQIPGTGLTVHHVSGKASIKDGILYIDTQTGSVNESSIQTGELSVDLIHSDDYSFRGRFEIDVDLSSLPGILISLLPDTALAEELKQVESLQGTARADLSLSFETGQEQLEVIVKADAITGTGHYARIPGDFVIEQSGFEYQNHVAVIKNFNGRIHSQSLYNINATVTLKDNPHLGIDAGTAMMDLETLLPWIRAYDGLRDMISPVNDGQGHVYIDQIRFNGRMFEPGDWKYNVSGTCLNLRLDTENVQDTVTGLSGTFHFSNRFFQVEQVTAMIHTVDFLSLSPEKKAIEHIHPPFQLMNSRFVSEPEFSEFSGDITLAGDIQMTVKARKYAYHDAWQLKEISIEDLPLTDIKIRMDQELTPFDFSGKLNSDTLKKMVKKDSLLYEKIFKMTDDTAFTIESGLRDQIKITVESMDINHWFIQDTSAGFSWDAVKGKTILLDTESLQIKKLNFNDFKSRIVEKDLQTIIHISNAQLCGLVTKGIFTISENNVTCDLGLSESRNNELNATLLCLFDQADLITGPYTLRGQIQSQGTMADFFRAFQGDLAFNAQDGRIFRLTLLSRILSFLNVSKLFKGKLPDIIQQGFAYHQIDINAHIRNSRIELDRAVIDGKDMTLVFTGWIDPLENQLDLTCLVAPFKTVDMIISKIPVVSTLFNDRLISVPFKAKGKINDPVIIPLHPSSVGEGLVDLMVNILKTPVTLIEQTQ